MRNFSIILIALASFTAPALAQDTFDAVEKAAIAEWDAIDTLTGAFDIAGTFKIVPEQTTPISVTGSGTLQYAKNGGASRYKGQASAGFTPSTPVIQAQALFDGAAGQYQVLAPMFGLNQAGKAGNDEIVPPGGKLLFSALRQNFSGLTVLPSEKVAGVECHVIQGKPRDPGDIPVAKVTFWIAKQTGVVSKVWAADATGSQTLAAVVREIKLNTPIPESAFRFVPISAPAFKFPY